MPERREYIDIVFRGEPGAVLNFVEVESPAGQSIRVGDWIRPENASGHRYWRLRLYPDAFRSSPPELRTRVGTRGFWIQNEDGVSAHVQGDPKLADDPKARRALAELLFLAKNRLLQATILEKPIEPDDAYPIHRYGPDDALTVAEAVIEDAANDEPGDDVFDPDHWDRQERQRRLDAIVTALLTGPFSNEGMSEKDMQAVVYCARRLLEHVDEAVNSYAAAQAFAAE